jgi:hypothetical protein
MSMGRSHQKRKTKRCSPMTRIGYGKNKLHLIAHLLTFGLVVLRIL